MAAGASALHQHPAQLFLHHPVTTRLAPALLKAMAQLPFVPGLCQERLNLCTNIIQLSPSNSHAVV